MPCCSGGAGTGGKPGGIASFLGRIPSQTLAAAGALQATAESIVACGKAQKWRSKVGSLDQLLASRHGGLHPQSLLQDLEWLPFSMHAAHHMQASHPDEPQPAAGAAVVTTHVCLGETYNLAREPLLRWREPAGAGLLQRRRNGPWLRGGARPEPWGRGGRALGEGLSAGLNPPAPGCPSPFVQHEPLPS